MIVLDTNVLSEVMKPAPDPAVARWMFRFRIEQPLEELVVAWPRNQDPERS